MSRNYLSMNNELWKGDSLISNNGEYKDDGNFVVYGWKPLWATNTNGIAADCLIMQKDCNLVMYTMDKPVWAINTHQPSISTCRLTLGNDGFLVINNGRAVAWKSTKSS